MTFDEKVFIRALIDRPADAKRYSQSFHPSWLKTAEYQPILAKIFEFTEKFNIPPSIETLRDLFIEEDKNSYDLRYKDTIDQIAIIEYDESKVLNTLDKVHNIMISWSLDKLIKNPDFVHSMEGFEGADVIREVHKWVTQFEGSNEDVEFRIEEAVEALIKTRGWNVTSTAIDTGIEFLDTWCGGGLKPRQLGIIVAPTGSGKCFVKNTKILMYNGGLKEVQYIQKGDMLMGPDSQPRTVQSTTSGYGELFDIIPVKGQKFTCNADHILALEYTGGNESKRNKTKIKGYKYNISVKEYLNQSKTQKHLQKLWRTGVDFPASPTTHDPYFIGVYLGDGTRGAPSITIGDKDTEIKAYLYKWADKNDHKIHLKKKRGATLFYFRPLTRAHQTNKVNRIRKSLMNKDRDRIIPHEYKVASKADRLQLLAGILDADGYLSHGTFDFVTKYKTLADDIAFVARSLGLGVNLTLCKKGIKSTGFIEDYYRLNISGHINQIPCKLKRRQAMPRLQKKSVLRTGFRIEPAGSGDYYGFQLDKDHLFLLEDFTVSHNSMCLMVMAYKMAVHGQKRVMFISNELSMGEITERFGALIAQVDQDKVIHEPTIIRKGLDKLTKYNIKDKLHLVEVNREISTDDIEAMIGRNINLYGWAPEVVVVDYMERMKPTATGMSRENTSGWFGEIAKDLIRTSKRTGTLIWTACQTNRTGYNTGVEQNITQAQGSIKHFQEASAVIAMRQRADLTEQLPSLKNTSIKVMEFAALKMRHARRDDVPILVEADMSKMAITKNYHRISEWDKAEEEETGMKNKTGKGRNKGKTE